MIVVLLLSILAWAPLLYPGFIQTHSGLGAVYDTLSAGLPFSGWLPAYGTPGDGPLATWLLVILKAAIGSLAALKLLYAASFVLAGVGMYLLARRLWGSLPAIVAASVYMLLPYRLAAVYVRGALAESLLLAGAPFLFLALYDASQSPRRRDLLAVALLSLTLTLISFGLGILTIAVALLWSATTPVVAESPQRDDRSRRTPDLPQMEAASPQRDDRSRRTPHLAHLVAVAVGVALAIIMLVPASSSVFANMPGWSDHFVYFFQLFSPTWGFGESLPGWQDGMSFQLGLAPVALAVLALWGAYEGDDAQQRRQVIVAAVLAGVLAFLALTAAAPVWRLVPLSALVAYPWQLLGLVGIALALLAGAAARTLMPPDKPESLTIVAVLLAATILASYSYLAPRFMNAEDIPDLSRPPLAQLGSDILLLDARVDKEAQAGGEVKLTLFWEALHQPGADFTTYAHLVDTGGVMRGQQDARPQKGDKPTNTWLRGEVVRDEITVPIKADAPPGEYRLAVGMYLLATMERLPVAGSDQSEIILGPITIK